MFSLYHKKAILFDTLSILLPPTVSENCFETPGLNPFSISCTKLRCPLLVWLESYLIGKSWSSEDWLPRLTFTCFCFIFGTVPLVFVCEYIKCRRTSESYFLFPGWMSPTISMYGLSHISFSFPVELSYLILCYCHTMLFH